MIAAHVEALRSILHTVDETCSPAEQDQIYAALISHIRARRPESVSPLGTLPAPEQRIVDPRVKP